MCWCWVVSVFLGLERHCFRFLCPPSRCTAGLPLHPNSYFLLSPTPSYTPPPPTHPPLPPLPLTSPPYLFLDSNLRLCLSFHSSFLALHLVAFCGCTIFSSLPTCYPLYSLTSIPTTTTTVPPTPPPSSSPVSLPAQPSLWIIFNELLYSGRQISAPTHHWAQGWGDALCILISSEPPLCY